MSRHWFSAIDIPFDHCYLSGALAVVSSALSFIFYSLLALYDFDPIVGGEKHIYWHPSRLMRSGGLALTILALWCQHLIAQEKLLPVYHFNHLSTADGLPSDNIQSRVCRDSKGFVWVGTGNGLSRFDGYAFKTYRNQPTDSSSLSSCMVEMVEEDSKHRLWVGTWDAGLSLYDPGNDRFTNFYARPGDSTWLHAD